MESSPGFNQSLSTGDISVEKLTRKLKKLTRVKSPTILVLLIVALINFIITSLLHLSVNDSQILAWKIIESCIAGIFVICFGVLWWLLSKWNSNKLTKGKANCLNLIISIISFSFSIFVIESLCQQDKQNAAYAFSAYNFIVLAIIKLNAKLNETESFFMQFISFTLFIVYFLLRTGLAFSNQLLQLEQTAVLLIIELVGNYYDKKKLLGSLKKNQLKLGKQKWVQDIFSKMGEISLVLDSQLNVMFANESFNQIMASIKNLLNLRILKTNLLKRGRGRESNRNYSLEVKRSNSRKTSNKKYRENAPHVSFDMYDEEIDIEEKHKEAFEQKSILKEKGNQFKIAKSKKFKEKFENIVDNKLETLLKDVILQIDNAKFEEETPKLNIKQSDSSHLQFDNIYNFFENAIQLQNPINPHQLQTLRIFPFKKGKAKGIFLLIQNNTNDLEKEIKSQETHFLKILSTEIQNPLANAKKLLKNSKLFLKNYSKKDQTINAYQENFLCPIKANVRLLDVLLSNFCDFSEIKQGRTQFKYLKFKGLHMRSEHSEMEVILKKSIKLAKNFSHEIDFVYLIESNVPESIQIDKQRLFQIFISIFITAIRINTAHSINIKSSMSDDRCQIKTVIKIEGENIESLTNQFFDQAMKKEEKFSSTIFMTDWIIKALNREAQLGLNIDNQENNLVISFQLKYFSMPKSFLQLGDQFRSLSDLNSDSASIKEKIAHKKVSIDIKDKSSAKAINSEKKRLWKIDEGEEKEQEAVETEDKLQIESKNRNLQADLLWKIRCGSDSSSISGFTGNLVRSGTITQNLIMKKGCYNYYCEIVNILEPSIFIQEVKDSPKEKDFNTPLPHFNVKKCNCLRALIIDNNPNCSELIEQSLLKLGIKANKCAFKRDSWEQILINTRLSACCKEFAFILVSFLAEEEDISNFLGFCNTNNIMEKHIFGYAFNQVTEKKILKLLKEGAVDYIENLEVFYNMERFLLHYNLI